MLYSTGVKRVLDGEIRLIVKGSDSKMNVKYTTLPSNYNIVFVETTKV